MTPLTSAVSVYIFLHIFSRINDTVSLDNWNHKMRSVWPWPFDFNTNTQLDNPKTYSYAKISLVSHTRWHKQRHQLRKNISVEKKALYVCMYTYTWYTYKRLNSAFVCMYVYIHTYKRTIETFCFLSYILRKDWCMYWDGTWGPTLRAQSSSPAGCSGPDIFRNSSTVFGWLLWRWKHGEVLLHWWRTVRAVISYTLLLQGYSCYSLAALGRH